MVIHLVDGTYELFRHFYGLRRFTKGKDRPYGAVVGVLQTVFRCSRRARRMSAWPPITSSNRFATSSGPATRPARASSRRCGRNSIRSKTRWRPWAWWFGRWSSLRRMMHWRRPRTLRSNRAGWTRSASGQSTRTWRNACKAIASCKWIAAPRRCSTPMRVRAKYGVVPALIPDYLALVGDAADGYPGIAGIGAVSAARMLNRYGPIEAFPANVLGEQRKQALLFKKLATSRPTRSSSATLRRCAGAGRPTHSPRGPSAGGAAPAGALPEGTESLQE